MKNLWVRYSNSNWVLKEISFRIKEGELVVFAGESGSGKSTLARTISGFIPYFYEGEVKGEIDVYGLNPVETGPEELFGIIGFLGQDPALYTISTSVIGEIVYPMEVIGYTLKEIDSRISYLNNFFGLEKLLEKSITEISSGELQRVAISSIHGVDPKVYVLDEPLARLDPEKAHIVSRLLRSIADEGKIVLVFEHHLDEILPICDRVIVLKEGRMVFDGEPRKSLRYLADVDLPIISEIFLELGCDDSNIPLEVDEVEFLE